MPRAVGFEFKATGVDTVGHTCGCHVFGTDTATAAFGPIVNTVCESQPIGRPVDIEHAGNIIIL